MRTRKLLLLLVAFFSVFFVTSDLNATEQMNTQEIWDIREYIEDETLQQGILEALQRKGISVNQISDITLEMLANLSYYWDYVVVSGDIKSTKGFSDIMSNYRLNLIIQNISNNQNIDVSGLRYSAHSLREKEQNPLHIINEGQYNLNNFNTQPFSQYYQGEERSTALYVFSGFKDVRLGEIVNFLEGDYPYSQGKYIRANQLDPMKYAIQLNENNYHEFEIPLDKLYVNNSNFEIAPKEVRRNINKEYGIYYNIELIYNLNISFDKAIDKTGAFVKLQKLDKESRRPLEGAVFLI